MSDAAAASSAGAAAGGSSEATAAAYAALERERTGEAPGGVAECGRGAGGVEGEQGPDPRELGTFLDALDHYNPTVRGCVYVRGIGFPLRLMRGVRMTIGWFARSGRLPSVWLAGCDAAPRSIAFRFHSILRSITIYPIDHTHPSHTKQIPEEVTAYFLQQSGVQVTDPRMYVHMDCGGD